MGFNIIDQKMSSDNLRPNHLETSLDFEKEFTYINIIQDEAIKDEKKKRYKNNSKIGALFLQKGKGNSKKNLTQPSFSKSEIRKKSKTIQRSPSKKLSEKKYQSKNYEVGKKVSKTLEPKAKEMKIKSTKSLKINNNRKIIKQRIAPALNSNVRNKPAKDLSPQLQKTFKSQKSKSHRKTKISKAKSESEFDHKGCSDIKKYNKMDEKSSKVIHEYFGMDEKLSSIVEEKNKKHKKSESKLSKCKTHSSSSSITMKNGVKSFNKVKKSKK